MCIRDSGEAARPGAARVESAGPDTGAVADRAGHHLGAAHQGAAEPEHAAHDRRTARPGVQAALVRLRPEPVVAPRGLGPGHGRPDPATVSYTHLRAHETVLDLVCRL